jgi:hypothetical protein
MRSLALVRAGGVVLLGLSAGRCNRHESGAPTPVSIGHDRRSDTAADGSNRASTTSVGVVSTASAATTATTASAAPADTAKEHQRVGDDSNDQDPALKELQARIEKALSRAQERPIAAHPPSHRADGSWVSSSGGKLVRVYIVSWDRPAEVEGTPTTAYFEPSRQLVWLHEGGGLSTTEVWYGPFPL